MDFFWGFVFFFFLFFFAFPFKKQTRCEAFERPLRFGFGRPEVPECRRKIAEVPGCGVFAVFFSFFFLDGYFVLDFSLFLVLFLCC